MKAKRFSQTKDLSAKAEFSIIKGLSQTYNPVNPFHVNGNTSRIAKVNRIKRITEGLKYFFIPARLPAV
jgi:hypothetical protein